MIWFLIKGLLILFAFFTATGTIGNLFGYIFFKLSSKLNNGWLLVASTLFLVIFGMLAFSLMGMFYATYTFTLTAYFKLWFAISIVSVFILTIYVHTVKEYMKLKVKTASDYFIYNPHYSEYRKRHHIDTKTILSTGHFIVLSYVYFLLFQENADKASFGLTTYLISLIN